VLSILALALAQAAPTTIQVPADYPTLQLAINAAGSGDTIVAAPGTYPESIIFIGKSITLTSSGGPQVTTIDGSGFLKSVITYQGSSGVGTSTLQGFTITGGDTVIGGGVLTDTDLNVDNCIFTGNMADTGAGMASTGTDADLTITGCTFADNLALNLGGGLYISEAQSVRSVTIADSLFRDNTAANGGGVYLNRNNSDCAVTRCTFLSNEATDSGGGLQQVAGDGLSHSLTVQDSVFANNEAANDGGGIHSAEADDLVINCTLYANQAGMTGGGLYRGGSVVAVTTLANNIFWDNEASVSGSQAEGAGPLQYNLIQGASPSLGVGTINQAPGFRAAGSNDFRLRPGSPCIDAGDTTLVTSTLDILGLPRAADDLGTPDTGAGVAPLVDLGANEFQGDSTGQVPAVIVNSGPLQAGQFASLKAIAMPPGQPTWIFATSLGNGPTFVPALELYLDLTSPRSYFTSRPSNASGEVVWDFTMPIGASGRTIFFQAAQFQLKTAILTETVL
jgi:predicted outer membrane repeat protein